MLEQEYQPTSWQIRGWQLGKVFPIKVLACMLRDPDFASEVLDCVDPTYFSQDDQGILASMIIEYVKKNGYPPTKETISIIIFDRCKTIDPDGSLGRVNSLQIEVSKAYEIEIKDILLIKDKVREFGRLQSVAKGIRRAVSLIEDTNPNKDGSDVISKIQEVINDACQVGTDKTVGVCFNDVAFDIPQILINDKIYGQESKVPTGIEMLDKVLDGGPGAGTINVFMGPPNRGKSTILSYVGIQAAKHFQTQSLTTGVQKSVIHITLEMTEPDILAKYASGLTGIETNLLTKAHNYQQLVKSRLSQFGKTYIKFYPPGTATVDDIQWYISNLVTTQKVKPGILIVDYADKLRGMEDDRFNGMGIIYNQFIAMGHKFGVPVWTGSQVNREETKKKRHGITGAAESWKKIEIADNVILLNQTEEEHEQGLLIIGFGKIRRGSRKVGCVNCKVDYGRVLITQLQENEYSRPDAEEVMKEYQAPDYRIPDVEGVFI